MTSMLDIAGGIIIAAVILRLFELGVEAALSEDRRFGGILGWLAAMVALAATVWLVLVRTGILPGLLQTWLAQFP
jgi:hypothetical protein